MTRTRVLICRGCRSRGELVFGLWESGSRDCGEELGLRETIRHGGRRLVPRSVCWRDWRELEMKAAETMIVTLLSRSTCLTPQRNEDQRSDQIKSNHPETSPSQRPDTSDYPNNIFTKSQFQIYHSTEIPFYISL